jgi:hypothetical protein
MNSIGGIRPSTPEQRHQAAEWLEQHFAKIAARQRSWTDEKFEATLAEALKAVWPGAPDETNS